MKKTIVIIAQLLLFMVGLPFLICDLAGRNRVCNFVINKVNKGFDRLNYWGSK